MSSFFSLWVADSPRGGVETIRVSCSPGHGLSKTVKDTFIWRFVHKIGRLTAAYYSEYYEWNVLLFAESLRCTNSKTRKLWFFERAKQTDRRQFATASHIWKSFVFNPLPKSVNFSCVNKLIRNKKTPSINILFHSHVYITTANVVFATKSCHCRIHYFSRLGKKAKIACYVYYHVGNVLHDFFVHPIRSLEKAVIG